MEPQNVGMGDDILEEKLPKHKLKGFNIQIMKRINCRNVKMRTKRSLHHLYPNVKKITNFRNFKDTKRYKRLAKEGRCESLVDYFQSQLLTSNLHISNLNKIATNKRKVLQKKVAKQKERKPNKYKRAEEKEQKNLKRIEDTEAKKMAKELKNTQQIEKKKKTKKTKTMQQMGCTYTLNQSLTCPKCLWKFLLEVDFIPMLCSLVQHLFGHI